LCQHLKRLKLFPSNPHIIFVCTPSIEPAQLAGIDPKDIDVQVTPEAISISGERRYENTDEKSRYIRSEFRYGKIHRVLTLPAPIQNDSVQAE
jgi:HSP20 family protein